MGSTFDDEIEQGGAILLPYCHAPTYKTHPNTELIAGVDPHDEQREIFGDRWGLAADQLFANHKDLLEQTKPDIVSITTTARHRPQIVLDAVNTGVKAIWPKNPLPLVLLKPTKWSMLVEKKALPLRSIVLAVTTLTFTKPNR